MENERILRPVRTAPTDLLTCVLADRDNRASAYATSCVFASVWNVGVFGKRIDEPQWFAPKCISLTAVYYITVLDRGSRSDRPRYRVTTPTLTSDIDLRPCLSIPFTGKLWS